MNGFTKEEKFLNSLGEQSFLRFWSWPNLFRDQGGQGDGKEICDLTIIFGNDVLLFSDKKIEFNNKKDINVAWSRWARRAIGDSVKQIKGARRWLSNHADRVFLDPQCRQKIPIDIPPKESIQFHNIVVCHGIEDTLKSFNQESSFAFDNTIKGDQHWNKEECRPFSIGQIFEGDFVHIFNESTIEIVLSEFDTAKDFIHYLSQRESLLSSPKKVLAASEADILQLYYENYNDKVNGRSIWSEDLFNKKEIEIDKGGIHNLFTNPAFIAKKIEDKSSYFWDSLIEAFSFHILNNSTESKSWEHTNEIEPCVRSMAELGRFQRRILASTFLEFYEKALPGQRGTRLCFDPAQKNRAYLFFTLPFDSKKSNLKEYRILRRKMLEDYCVINKAINPSIENIIGIACKTRSSDDPISDDFFSEGQDFAFIDFSDWKDTDTKNAQKIHDEYVSNGLLGKRKFFLENISEFPDSTNRFRRVVEVKGKERNMPCICGSGKKIKKCCGKPN